MTALVAVTAPGDQLARYAVPLRIDLGETEMTEPIAYDPERHDPPAILNVHLAALQEIDKVVGNELTLDEDDTARLRGIIFAALSEQHLRRSPGLHTYREAATRGGLLFQHTCGRVRAFNRPPADGRCHVGSIRCPYESEAADSWQPLYRADAQP